MSNNILGSVSYATLANFPIKRTLQNEREIATQLKMTTFLMESSEAGLHSNFTAKAVQVLRSIT